MTGQVVTYRLGDATTVKFETDPPEGFRPAGPDEILGRLSEAIDPVGPEYTIVEVTCSFL